jgi:UMF1 family MFS transporter
MSPTDREAAARVGHPRRWLAAWCLFDCGCSAYPAIILSFVFAPYFAKHVASNSVTGTVLWGDAIAISAVAIALLSPVLGAFCDKGGRRKLWLLGCSAATIAAMASLWFVGPNPQAVYPALILVVASNTFFELGYVFYNGMLPTIVAPEAVGRASGWGWSTGYFGSLICIGATWLILVRPKGLDIGLDRGQFEHLRAAAPLAAAWFAAFALPLFLTIPDLPSTGLGAGQIVRSGLSELAGTVRTLRRHRSIAWYLAAHMAYTDALNTLFTFAPIFGATVFGLTETELLIFGLGVYVCAGIGSIVFGWADDWLGARPVLVVSLAAFMLLCAGAMRAGSKQSFVVVGLSLGFFFGPVQAASRSLMARLSPPDLRNQMFGLYALAGRATAPIGPFLVSWLIAVTLSQRAGLAVVIVLTALGTLLLLPVREPRR